MTSNETQSREAFEAWYYDNWSHGETTSVHVAHKTGASMAWQAALQFAGRESEGVGEDAIELVIANKLNCHRLQDHFIEGTDKHLSLVDRLSPGPTIKEGQEEIDRIAEMLTDAIIAMRPPAKTVQADKYAIADKLTWRGSKEDFVGDVLRELEGAKTVQGLGEDEAVEIMCYAGWPLLFALEDVGDGHMLAISKIEKRVSMTAAYRALLAAGGVQGETIMGDASTRKDEAVSAQAVRASPAPSEPTHQEIEQPLPTLPALKQLTEEQG